MGSQDEATPNRQKDESSSLAARRARLRGSLAKQAIPTDPYVQAQSSVAAQSSTVPADDSKDHQEMQNVKGSQDSINQANASNQASQSSQSSQNPDATQFSQISDDEFEYDPTNYNANSYGKNSKGSSALTSAFSGVKHDASSQYAGAPQFPHAAGNAPAIVSAEPDNSGYQYGVDAMKQSYPAASQQNAPTPVYGSVSGQSWTNPIGTMSANSTNVISPPVPVAPMFEEEVKPSETSKKGRNQKGSGSKENSRQSDAELEQLQAEQAVRDRAQIEREQLEKEMVESELELARMAQEQLDREIEAEFQAPAVVSIAMQNNTPSSQSSSFENIQLPDPLTFATSTTAQAQVIELLNNMDQAMGACAMNLATLQKTAGEQTEALKALTKTLEHQTFSELGLNLSSMMESLSAALEPMKAVGELVPAIDSLVAEMGGKVTRDEPFSRLSPEQLLINLTAQLASGLIDPWIFKSAYTAVFPAESQADLLHRLVDLLGSQKLSGETFRYAYDAVQSAEAPPVRHFATGSGGTNSSANTSGSNGTVTVVQDEALIAQLEQLKQQQESFEAMMHNREQEHSAMLGAKDQELHDAQELLHSRWDEFNSRYDELSDSLVKRDEVLQEKETEIARKESENIQLRAQMEELRDMMTDLQKQFSSGKSSQSNDSQAGFFDVAPSRQQPGSSAQPQSLFDAEPAKPLFQHQSDVTETNIPISPVRQPQAPANQGLSQGVAAPGARAQQSQTAPPQSPQQPQPMQAQLPPSPPVQSSQQGVPTQPQINQQASSQAVPRQGAVTTPFAGAGPGSYGSGVRAQVFEVIVRQALAGAPWREICAGPMQVNNISPDEVEVEVKRRQALLKK